MPDVPPPRSTSSPTHHPRSRRPAALLLTAALALTSAAAACSTSDPQGPTADDKLDRSTTTTAAPPAPSPSTSPPSTTTAPPKLTPEAKVEAAYREANEAYYELIQSPTASLARLDETRIDPNLAYVRSVIEQQAANGLVARFPDDKAPRVAVRVVTVNGTQASLESCDIDNGQQVRISNEQVVDDDVVSTLTRSEMRFVDGTWKVSSERGLKTWPDGRGCDR